MTDHQYNIGLAIFYLTYICRCVSFVLLRALKIQWLITPLEQRAPKQSPHEKGVTEEMAAIPHRHLGDYDRMSGIRQEF